MMGLGRRAFLRAGAASGIGILGGSFLSFEEFARAEQSEDHNFLFIELKGGVAWHYATDARDLATLPIHDPQIVKTIAVAADATTPPLTIEQQTEIFGTRGVRSTHGNVIILPYIGSLASSYRTGTTNAGTPWRLGISGDVLEPHIEDIAVVRGVRSIHDFHGGANDEAFSGIFSDRADQRRKHVAGTIAAHLAAERGGLLLDNIVFEGATFAGRADVDFSTPMRIDVRSLGLLAAAQAGKPAGSSEQRFARARQLADAVGDASVLGPHHREAFAAYLSALDKAPIIQRRLAEIAGQLGSSDASLNLDLQVDAALMLFQSRLSRVATLCLGAYNGMNNVDGAGLFDAHYGIVHKGAPGASRQRTYGHHLNVQDAMRSIARLIHRLKTTMVGGRSLFEQTTVVVTSEFARPSNCTGNEDSGGRLGAGHYQWNNNVLLFGKGVKGGAWIGENDPVTQYSHLVKMASLDQPDPTRIEYSVPPFFTLNTTTNVRNVPSTGRIDGRACEAEIAFVGGRERPIMPKDIMRTVYAIAGLDAKFTRSYGGNWFSDARTLRPILRA
jgi:hypothetical protein